MNETVEIRKATEQEIDVLLNIWIEKSKYLEEKKIKVWDIQQFTQEKLKEKYGEPQYFIGLANNRIFGAFILIEKDDKYWSDRLSEKAFYFHKFVVTNEFAGMGYSKIILDWVKNYGKQMGKEYIRLDFNESREYLKQLYYGNGFIKVRVYEENDKHKLVLAEIKI